MDYLIFAGVALSVLGIIGIIWCIFLALKARREGGTDDEIRSKLQRLVALNLGALLISAFGLMLVVMGVILA
ncbi:MAG: hypothetical protein ACJA2X_000398 [Halocynthiibacter sp.]|jgi:hypothetical protein